MALVGSPVFRTVVKALLRITGNFRIADAVRSLRPMSEKELHGLMKQHCELALKMKRKWEEAGVDALIMPNHPIPAFKATKTGDVGIFRDY